MKQSNDVWISGWLIRKTAAHLNPSNRRNLIKELDDRDEEEVRSPTEDSEANQRN